MISIAQKIKNQEFNEKSMNLIYIFAHKSKETKLSSLNSKLHNYIVQSNQEILKNTTHADNIIKNIISSIKNKAQFYKNYNQLQFNKKLLEAKRYTFRQRNINFIQIQEKTQKINDQLEKFPFEAFELITDDNLQSTLDFVLDQTQPDPFKKLRNFNFSNLTSEEKKIILNSNKLHTDQELNKFYSLFYEKAQEQIPEMFQEKSLDLLTSAIELDTSRPPEQVTKEDTFFTLLKKVWNSTVVNTAKIQKLTT